MGRISEVFCLLLVFGVCLTLSQKIIPKTRSLSDLSGGALPILRVVYCATSGYHRALDQYIALLNEKYQGEVQARGEPFQHSAWSRYVSRSLTALKLGLAALLLFKVNLLGRLQSRFPRLVEFTVNNRMMVTMSIFLLISTLESRLSATGHFEIFYNDVPVWSKLASGRFPSPGELFQIIDNQILIKNTPKLSL